MTLYPTTRDGSGGAVAFHQRIVLDPDCIMRFTTLAEHLATTREAMGRIVDESIQEAPGEIYHETIYTLYADLYYQATGERIAARTVRHWRDMAIKFSKHDLETFHLLPDSVRLESIVIADEMARLDSDNAKTPQQICQVALDDNLLTIPALRAKLAPPTYTDGETDPSWLSALKRQTRDWPPEDTRWPRLNRLLALLRALLK